MSTDRWERTKEILEEALGRAPDERLAYLDSVCGPDLELRAELESLIAHHDEAGSEFLAAPAREVLELNSSGKTPRSPLNQRIGNYRLVEEIGRGGMGVVWRAEQEAPVRRQVALKLIKAGMYDDAVLKRFEAERQSLALMDHPSIAKVFDAGTTVEGQPYFVMEYVPGVPITDYCDQKRLNIRGRLELFIKVCEGVQHAHQKAIIHRDLKPANILVQEIDGKPVPRIIDFGLAKATSPRIGGTSLFTQVGTFVGTPGYMSPEQCDPSARDVDTRTDVYALGVLLYVLLSGSLPFEDKEWKQRPFDEMLRLMREQDPPRPSTRVSSERKTSSATADMRGTEPKQLVSLLRGDLDWVTMKAIERDRTRRYGTPTELAADIQRYLANKPVQAHPTSIWYRGRKFVRRYRVPVAAGALVVASLSAGLYLANRERVLAQRRFQDVRELSNRLFDIDQLVRELPGSTKARQSIVDTSLEYLRRLAADVHGDPELALEVGSAYMRVARVEGVPISPNLGRMDRAEQDLQVAERFVHSVLVSQPANRTALLRSAQIAHDRMILAWFNGRPDEALSLARQSAEWLERFHAGKGDETEAPAVLAIYLNLAHQYVRGEQFGDALRLCDRAIQIGRSLNIQSYIGNFFRVKAEVFQSQGDLDEALNAVRESMRLLDPGASGIGQGQQTMGFVQSLTFEGKILGQDNTVSMGRFEEAAAALGRAFTITDDLVHRDPNDQFSRNRLADTGVNLGDVLRHFDARRSLDIYDHTLRHLAEVRNNSAFRRFEVSALAGSSCSLRRLGRPADARQRLDAAFERLRQIKLYPAGKVEPGSEAEDALRALAEYEADTGNLWRAIEIYQNILDLTQAANSRPENSLTDALDQSNLYRAKAALYRRAGQAGLASAPEARRRELWEAWDRKLANNAFVRRQLEAAHR